MPSDQANQYLIAGREAVAYVKSKVKFGASNNPLKLQSSVAGQLRAMGALSRTRKDQDRAMAAKFVNPADVLRVIQVMAESAERFGGGNCGEQSAMAYIQLRRRGIMPIDWAQFNHKDHAFVIIGRSSAGKYKAAEVPQQPWFPDAVICDPYWSRCELWRNVITEYSPTLIETNLHQESSDEIHVWKDK